MLALALTFFLIANPIGNCPAIISLVKGFDFNRQRIILLRESFFALLLALFFQYFGEIFLSFLHIQDYVVRITGGLLLSLVAIGMIFPIKKNRDETRSKDAPEPYIVPIATPIISGPGLLAIIMLKSSLVGDSLLVSGAILIAWIGVTAIMAIAPYLQKILGDRGLSALESVMGMILALMAVEMLVNGISGLLKVL